MFIRVWSMCVFYIILSACLSIPVWSQGISTNQNKIYQVGFKSLIVQDYSRFYHSSKSSKTITADGSRPIQISIWYPTKLNSKGKLVTVGQYRLLSNFEKAIGDWTETDRADFQKSFIEAATKRGQSAQLASALLQTKTKSIWNAPILNGKFPLIVYSPSMLGGVQGNTILYEYLAGLGYIVVAHPSFGENPKMMDTGLIGLETQVKDMEFVLGFMNHKFSQHIDSIGVMGHSWGGMAAVVVGMRHPEIKAVLSLDSSVEVWRDLVLNQPDYDPTKLRQPFMHFETKDNRDHGFYESVKYAAKYRICFPNLEHFDVISADYSNSSKTVGKTELYSRTNDFILAFFNAYLKGEKGKLTSIIENNRNSDRENLKIEWEAGKSPPPLQREIIQLFVSGQGEKAEKIIRQFKSENPEAYSEKELLQIGELVFWSWRHFPEALQIFTLAAEYYPNSARVQEMLGNVYSSTNRDADSLKYYEKSLKLSPNNLRVLGYINSINSKKGENVKKEESN